MLVMEIVSQIYIIQIVTSIILGTTARFLTLIVDYRQYPSYPNGYLTHLVTGFVAASIGSFAIPAVITKDFQAVTFLALAIEQFREVRRIESESLSAIDDVEDVPRGNAYIDGISKTFEARNYFSLLVALSSSIVMTVVPRQLLWVNIVSGIIAGAVVFYFIKHFSEGKNVENIANIKIRKLTVEDSELYVDDIFVSNHIGMEKARRMLSEEGVAVVITPKEKHFRMILQNNGQSQAILFECCKVVGVKKYHFIKKDYDTGSLIIVLVPIIKNSSLMIKTIGKTPLLESVKKSYEIMDPSFKAK